MMSWRNDNDSGVHPEPEMVIEPRVASAFHALSHCSGLDCENEEKMLFLLGRVEGMSVHCTDFAIPPQKGSGSWIETDEEHDNWNGFWPNLNDYLDENGLKVVGWAHYFVGGSHHSSEDERTDDRLSFSSKDELPIFLSATFNEDEVGCEALCHMDAGDVQMQVEVSDINVKWAFDDDTIERVVAELEDESSASVTAEFGDAEFEFTPEELGFNEGALAGVCLDAFAKDPSSYVNENDDLYERVMENMVIGDVVDTAQEMMEEFWRKRSPSTSSTVRRVPGAGRLGHGSKYGGYVRDDDDEEGDEEGNRRKRSRKRSATSSGASPSANAGETVEVDDMPSDALVRVYDKSKARHVYVKPEKGVEEREKQDLANPEQFESFVCAGDVKRIVDDVHDALLSQGAATLDEIAEAVDEGLDETEAALQKLEEAGEAYCKSGHWFDSEYEDLLEGSWY